MSELSRYSVRSLSETKSFDRTRKFPITFCLGEKVSFYFADQDFPLLLSFTLLVLYFIHIFRLCDGYECMFEPQRTCSCYGNAPKNCIPFRSLNFEHAQQLWRIRSYRFEQIQQYDTILCESRSATIPRFNIEY